MGYFNSAYEIYALLCVISTAGLPVALSMLVSSARARGDEGEIKGIFTTARALFFIIGATGSAFMLLSAFRLARYIGNPESCFSILAIAPALLFICLASAVRGYCQGFGDMMPTALSQLIEALSKLFLGVLFANIAIKKGYGAPTVAAFAVLGITVGTLLSLLYLSFARRKHMPKDVKKVRVKEKGALGMLLRIAFPITLGALVMGLTRIIDMALIMRRLQDAGASVAQSNKIYGAYTTLAVPVFSLIPALITPVSMALVPELSGSIERDDTEMQKKTVYDSMRLTTVFSLPAALGLAVFARPVLELLFYGQSEAIDISAPLLSVLGVSVVFSCLITTTNAILQSYRRVALPIASMAIGVIVKLAVSYVLIGDVRFGAIGAPIGSLACSVTVGALNLCFMKQEKGTRFSGVRVFLLPLTAAVLSVGGALATYIGISSYAARTVSFLICVAVAALSYIALSLLLGSVSKEDLALLPCGERILNKINFKNKRGRKNDCFGKEKDASREG
jgi:stage V sporulation protein B